jgi:iron complex outermembrane receptor protein
MPYRKPLTVTIAVLLGFPGAYAQTSAPEITDTGTAEAVIVTGSNIKRTDYEGPQTVRVIDRQLIDRSGARSLSELIGRLPQNSGGFGEGVNNGLSFSPGAAAASLRGLGVSSTLVLINGRRVSPFGLPQEGTDSFVDLNGIPLSAVERVEILKEGASAVYGSDAVAGVINIILKQNYSGGEVETYYGNTTRKDASEVRESLLSGFQNEKFHLMLSTNYLHRNPIADADRSYSVTADHRRMGGSDLRSSIGNPGTIFTSADALAVPRGSDGKLRPDQFLSGTLADGSIRNRYNFNKDSELTPETERWGGLLTFGYNLSPHLEYFGEASYESVQTKTVAAPTPGDLIVPASNPHNPFGEDVEALWRATEAGQRGDTTESDAYRYVTGFKLKDLPKNWTAEGSFLYSESNVVDYANHGYLSQSRADAALARTDPNRALNVFGDGRVNSRSLINELRIAPRVDGLAYIYDYQITASGEVIDLPAGPLSIALGGEYRDEFLRQTFSESANEVIGFGGAGSEGKRDVRSLFVEGSIPIISKKWNIPLLKELELTIAERYDDYSDFGQTTKPKFGFKLKPFDGLLFRGAYSEGLRAPSLPQLFSGQITAFDTVVNPRTGETGDVQITTGGDPALQPETSYSYFAGTIIEPPFIKGLSIEVDWYHIDQRNLIAQPTSQDVIDGRAAGVVSYDANNQITNISELFTNLGQVVTEGIDVDVNYKLETKIGTFTLDSSLAYVYRYKQSAAAGLPLESFLDTYGLPDFKASGSIFYKKGGFEIGTTVNYTSSYDDTRGNDRHPSRTVGSWTTVDLQMSYEWLYDPTETGGGYAKDGKTALPTTTVGVTGWRWLLNNAKVTVGCNNLGDVEPPFSNIEEGFDTATADATGRFVYASLKKKFW